MQRDLNTAAALAAMFDLVRSLNASIDAGAIGPGDLPAIREAFDGFDQVLACCRCGVLRTKNRLYPVEEIERLIGERQAARRRRDFAAGDRIRDDLAARGVLLEDSAAGTRWKRK